MRLLTIGWLIVAASFPPFAIGQEKSPPPKSLVGSPAPELISESTHWLGNSVPQSLARMKGKVIWLQFNF
jgi:hypothetical protein